MIDENYPYYMHPGLPKPAPSPDGLDAPFWEGLEKNLLLMQRCQKCNQWQWGPEWICHNCHSDDLVFDEMPKFGLIYSYERVWHPVHPALKEQGPYVVVLVEFPDHDGIRIVGNLLGDPHQKFSIGDEVYAVFERHDEEDPSYTLLQWEL